jgi:uncharacterized protein (TIGR03118 family)
MRIRKLLTMGIMFATGLVVGLPAQAASAHEAEGAFQQTNLVSNLPGLAPVTDPNLQNPWGMSSSSNSPIWVSDNNGDLTAGTGNAATLYNGAGQPFPPGAPLVVKIPLPDGSDGGAPTGQVFNGSKADFEAAPFIFATEDGTIAAWEPGIDLHRAQIEVDRSTIPTAANGAVYKGLAIGTNASGQHLYAANFRAGTIDVFDASFRLVTLDGSFTDRRIPTGFAPFDIQNLEGLLYVTYAKQKPDKHDDLAGPGNGFVDVYDLNGHLLHRLVRRGELNSPWGLAIAPADFGPFGGDLLVGNFGDGRINVYTRHGSFRGELRNDVGAPIQISGLWGLRVGNGGNGGDVHTVFFTAGINDEKDGLFGTITSVGHDDD